MTTFITLNARISGYNLPCTPTAFNVSEILLIKPTSYTVGTCLIVSEKSPDKGNLEYETTVPYATVLEAISSCPGCTVMHLNQEC